MNAKLTKLRLTLPLLSLLIAAPVAMSADGSSFLHDTLLKSDRTGETVLAALRVTGDADLLPLFEALSRSPQDDRREFAIDALWKVCKQSAVPALLERVNKDQNVMLRRLALAYLLDLKAITPAQLQEAMASSDPGVRCLAARGLVKADQKELARPALEELAKADDGRTSDLAATTLLAMGQTQYLQRICQHATNKATRDEDVVLLLKAAQEDETGALADLTKQLAQSDRPGPVQIQAFAVLLKVSPQSAPLATDAITKSQSTVFRTNLLRVLAASTSAQLELAKLATGEKPLSLLAQLELSRKDGLANVQAICAEALTSEHPVVLDYVLECAADDIKTRPADAFAYAAPLADFITSVPRDGDAPGPVHMRAAQAATLLIELGESVSLQRLRDILRGNYDFRQRAVAAALIRAGGNKNAADLAIELLESPREELYMDAVLSLAQARDPRVTPHLQKIVDQSDRHSVVLVTQVAWHLVQLQGTSKAAASQLAKLVK